MRVDVVNVRDDYIDRFRLPFCRFPHLSPPAKWQPFLNFSNLSSFCFPPPVHSFYELYGPEAAGKLLSTLSRLFTLYLRIHGHTTGIDDLILNQQAEANRHEVNQQHITSHMSARRLSLAGALVCASDDVLFR